MSRHSKEDMFANWCPWWNILDYFEKKWELVVFKYPACLAFMQQFLKDMNGIKLSVWSRVRIHSIDHNAAKKLHALITKPYKCVLVRNPYFNAWAKVDIFIDYSHGYSYSPLLLADQQSFPVFCDMKNGGKLLKLVYISVQRNLRIWGSPGFKNLGLKLML